MAENPFMSTSSGQIKVAGVTEEGVEEFFAEYGKVQKFIMDKIQDMASAQGALAEDPILKAMAETNINLRDFMDYLPRSEKERAMLNFRDLFKFDDALGETEDLINILTGRPPAADSRLTEIGEGMGQGRVLRFRVSADQIEPGAKRNPLTTILNDLNISVDSVKASRIKAMVDEGVPLSEIPKEDVRAAFRFGGNMMKSDYLRSVDKLVSGEMAIPKGSNILVFDTETLGLAVGKGNVREVSSVNMIYGGIAGVDEMKNQFDAKFTVASAQLGMIRNPNLKQNQRLFEYFNSIAASGEMVTDAGSGDDFVKAMKPFLRNMRNADFIMGHNVQFDISQVLTGVKLTSQYLNATDQELVELVDEATAKINGESVLDTLRIAKQKIPGVQTAPELAFAGKKTTHSLENLLLQTNLVDRMVEEAGSGQKGRAEVMRLLGMNTSGGMHQADVDTLVTAKLFKFMNEDGLVPQALGFREQAGSLSSEEADFYGRIRTFARRSYAPTPISNIADTRNLDERMFATLLEEGVTDEGRNRIRFAELRPGETEMTRLRLEKLAVAEGQSPIYEVGSRFRGTAPELQKILSKDIEPFSMFADITPIEQEVFLTRDLVRPAAAVPVTEDSFFELGTFRRATGIDEPNSKLINKVGTFFKRQVSAGEYSEVQAAMRKANMPFAGLSLPEAVMTNAMSRATAGYAQKLVESGAMPEPYGRVVSIADDIGISHFELWDKALVTEKSGKVQLPVQVLMDAGVMGESDELLSLSGFAYDDSLGDEINRVNLTKNLTQDQTDKLYQYIDNIDMDSAEGETFRKLFSKEGSGTDKVRILEGIRDSVNEYGISIGRVEGEAAEKINTVLSENVLFEQFNRDTNKIPFRVRSIDMFVEPEAKGFIRVGPMVLDRFMDEGAQQAYGESSRAARTMLDDLVNLATEPSGGRLLNAAEFGIKSGSSKVGKRAFDAYKVARKATPFAIGAAVIGGGALMFANKKRDYEFYDETMETESYENSGDYVQYRKEMGMSPAPARRLPDPLLTSHVVGNLDQGKIGHTQMGPQKYSHLYQTG